MALSKREKVHVIRSTMKEGKASPTGNKDENPCQTSGLEKQADHEVPYILY